MEPETQAPATPQQPVEQSNQQLPGAFSLFKPSMAAVKLNLGSFILIFILPAALGFLSLGFMSPGKVTDNVVASATLTTTAILLILSSIVLSLLLYPALTYLQLESAKGNKVGAIDTVKNSYKYFWRLLGLAVLTVLVIILGFLLLIVPGFFMIRRYLLAPYYLVDGDLGVIEAMKRSANDSKEFSYAIWGIIGVMILIEVLGIIPILGAIAGAILQILYYCAPAIRYFQIKQVASPAVN